ncbi:uncharacterized protein B0T15DRAFT_325472 [Chaetomium strumarium]|uniref:Uncharacterized protein n=1 Tax=Chaetomium strumarium TaxID=1170767 RepID=A0AAJ0GL22_9PEZI|nr:hypothetical protein B0T15DRAFT_325472 [Chaetomium strumarium]
MWKEIQSHLCIDVQSETADPDFRLLDPCKMYCGSLVKVQRNNGLVCLSGSDDVVELVHETARRYLLETGRFYGAGLHTEIALFYHSSAPKKTRLGKTSQTEARLDKTRRRPNLATDMPCLTRFPKSLGRFFG